jgi:hypothetical protein
MRKLTLVMIAAATLRALSVSPAHAGATCKIIPSFCPRLRVTVVAAARSPFRSPQRWRCWRLVLRRESLLLAGGPSPLRTPDTRT